MITKTLIWLTDATAMTLYYLVYQFKGTMDITSSVSHPIYSGKQDLLRKNKNKNDEHRCTLRSEIFQQKHFLKNTVLSKVPLSEPVFFYR